MLVVDASVVATAVADGGADGIRHRQRLRGERLAAPDLLRIDVLSVIRRQLSVGLLTGDQAERAVDDLQDLPITVYPTSALIRRSWELRDNIAAYDACYVALAEALRCTLLTADTRLSRAPTASCPIEIV